MKFNHILKAIGLSVLMLASVHGANAKDAGTKEFKARALSLAKTAVLSNYLKKSVPGIEQVDAVLTTPVPGVYEVRVNRSVFYATADGKYLINGHIFETDTQRNLTNERLESLKEDVSLKELVLSDAIHITHGEPVHKIAVFADPNCTYCKSFERTLKQVNNIEAFVFLTPILGRDSVEKSRDIWCSSDPAKKWQDWMLNAIEPEITQNENCDLNFLLRNMKLSQDIGVTGTPVIIFEDGSRADGAMNVDALRKKLESLQAMPSEKEPK